MSKLLLSLALLVKVDVRPPLMHPLMFHPLAYRDLCVSAGFTPVIPYQTLPLGNATGKSVRLLPMVGREPFAKTNRAMAEMVGLMYRQRQHLEDVYRLPPELLGGA